MAQHTTPQQHENLVKMANARAAPFHRLLGIQLVEWRPDHTLVHLPLRAELYNGQEIPHGGSYATLLDIALGYAGCFSADPEQPRFAVTLSLTTNFIAVPQGHVLIARGTRTGGGKSTFFAEGHITDEWDNLVASATGVFRYRQAVPHRD